MELVVAASGKGYFGLVEIDFNPTLHRMKQQWPCSVAHIEHPSPQFVLWYLLCETCAVTKMISGDVFVRTLLSLAGA